MTKLRWRTLRRLGVREDMRRVLCLLIWFVVSTGASAATLTLADPVELRSRPGAERPVVATVPAGGELTVLQDGREWVLVSFAGQSFYAPAAQLAAAAPSDRPGPDPTCDYGYPYSGSGLFFARPLAQLRHSEPLGFLLGRHRFYPC
jgi:hypothetical protein